MTELFTDLSELKSSLTLCQSSLIIGFLVKLKREREMNGISIFTRNFQGRYNHLHFINLQIHRSNKWQKETEVQVVALAFQLRSKVHDLYLILLSKGAFNSKLLTVCERWCSACVSQFEHKCCLYICKNNLHLCFISPLINICDWKYIYNKRGLNLSLALFTDY